MTSLPPSLSVPMAQITKPIILYDLDSTLSPKSCWSINTWKTHFALNYKQLPHMTKWVHLPDLQAELATIQAPMTNPNDSKCPRTVPTIMDSNGTVIADSYLISKYLDEKYKGNSIFGVQIGEEGNREQVYELHLQHERLIREHVTRKIYRLVSLEIIGREIF